MKRLYLDVLYQEGHHVPPPGKRGWWVLKLQDRSKNELSGSEYMNGSFEALSMLVGRDHYYPTQMEALKSGRDLCVLAAAKFGIRTELIIHGKIFKQIKERRTYPRSTDPIRTEG